MFAGGYLPLRMSCVCRLPIRECQFSNNNKRSAESDHFWLLKRNLSKRDAASQHMCKHSTRMEKSHSVGPRTCRLLRIWLWPLFFRSLIILPSTNRLVYWLLNNEKRLACEILYHSYDGSCFVLVIHFTCFVLVIHFTTLVFRHSAISPSIVRIQNIQYTFMIYVSQRRCRAMSKLM